MDPFVEPTTRGEPSLASFFGGSVPAAAASGLPKNAPPPPPPDMNVVFPPAPGRSVRKYNASNKYGWKISGLSSTEVARILS